MTSKKYRIIWISGFIITTLLVGWAAMSGYAWVSVPVFIASVIVLGLLRVRVKELTFDERAFSITEKSYTLASIIFIFVAVIIGLTLIAFGRDKPIMLTIGFTLLGSGCVLTLLFSIFKFYISRKMGGKV
jgi:uncharacterized membrane protein